MGIKVKLRRKDISGKRQSLYLDFYPPISMDGGKPTRRQFLNLYIFEKPKNVNDKKHNSDTLDIAERIRQNKDNFLNKPEIYSEEEKQKLLQINKGKLSFIKYFESLAEIRKDSNHDNWLSALEYLKKFSGGDLTFSEVTEKFSNGFRLFLLTTKTHKSETRTLAQNSVVSYFNKYKAALNQAFKEGYLQTDINGRIESVKQAETKRNYLTLEELQKLVKTECSIPILKQAALFSALTGLRFSDIEKLKWSEIHYKKSDGYTLHFTQKKTKGVEYLPISDQAFNLLGKRNNVDEFVFSGLKYSAWVNLHLSKWILRAGITKDITFHSFRHTFATLQLSLGTDIYTVSKLLGHRELKTTQIYAKVIDGNKRKAVSRIKINI
jgi:integrase